MRALFKDRKDAGRQLGLALVDHFARRGDARGSDARRDDMLVLGLARGGVPVAREVASLLRAPLDVLLVRKLGLPKQPEYAMGAIASGGVTVLDDEVIQTMGVSEQALDAVMARERKELARREALYRREPSSTIEGRTVILVDDGLATGSTMRAAIASVKRRLARAVVVAVPVAASETCEMIRQEADDVICLATPEIFRAVGLWYQDFPQVSDDEVREALA